MADDPLFRSTLDAVAERIAEKSTRTLRFVTADENGDAVGAAELATLTLTLYDKRSKTILNSRDHQSILNANGGTVDASGNGELVLADADNALVSQGRSSEMHVALIEWTWAGGTKSGRHEIVLTVENLQKVPVA